jgi:hypothetical protein
MKRILGGSIAWAALVCLAPGGPLTADKMPENVREAFRAKFPGVSAADDDVRCPQTAMVNSSSQCLPSASALAANSRIHRQAGTKQARAPGRGDRYQPPTAGLSHSHSAPRTFSVPVSLISLPSLFPALRVRTPDAELRTLFGLAPRTPNFALLVCCSLFPIFDSDFGLRRAESSRPRTRTF